MAAQVEGDHLANVHSVNMVGAKHNHQVRRMPLDQSQVLINGVRSPLKPLRALAHLRRDHGDELLGEDGRQDPGAADVLDQRLRLVLDQEVNGKDLRIDQVGKDKIDDAVPTAEGNRGLGPMFGKRMQTRAFAACEDDGNNIRRIQHFLCSR
jgi:hypothetical protein